MHTGTPHRSLLGLAASLAAALLAMLALAATAGAEEPKGFGEITRFGETGTEAGKITELGEHQIGVDPTDNSVYVLDEPTPAAEEGKKCVEELVEGACLSERYEWTETRHVRVQKFKANTGTGKYEAVASAEFTESFPYRVSPQERRVAPVAEGIAVDPKTKRLYVLMVDTRQKTLKQDAATLNNITHEDLPVAAGIYSFSTQDSGGKLPTAGKSAGDPLFVGGTELGASSETPGTALLAPRGITVNTETGQLLILAHQDTVKSETDVYTNDRYVLQAVNDETGALGSRWVDTKGQLAIEKAIRPHSPVAIAEGGGKSRIDVSDAGIWEIPFPAGEAHRVVTDLAKLNEGIVTGVGGNSEAGTGGETAAGAEGTLWSLASIRNPDESIEFGLGTITGLMSYTASGEPLGYTGAETVRTPAKDHDACVTEPYNVGFAETQQVIAAGSGGKVFALVPEYLLRFELISEEEEEGGAKRKPYKAPFFPGIVEYGPGGTGCPDGEAPTTIEASVSGVPVKEETLKAGTTVKFSVQSPKVSQAADVTKVEWKFNDGTAPVTVVTKGDLTNPSIEHRFLGGGEFSVEAKVYLDNLAAKEQVVYSAGKLLQPTRKLSRTVKIGLGAPLVKLSAPATLAAGEAGGFSAEAKDFNTGGTPLKYTWSFGDGSPPETGESAVATHTYTAAGAYTVKLTVKDKLGQETTVEASVEVTAPPAPKEEPKTTPPPPPDEKHQVLSYSAAVAKASPVAANGSFTITIACTGTSSCSGTIALKTAAAVAAKAKKRVLVLGSASFSIPAGRAQAVTIRLSAQARKYLAKVHTLRALATISGRDAEGVAHPGTASVTLTLARKKH